MLAGLAGMVATMCGGCAIDQHGPTMPSRSTPEVLVNQQVSDGCTRFALKVVSGVATVEALHNTNGCQTDQLQLLADSAPTFDAATGKLRVPIVMKNVGTVAVVAPARIRFVADSSQFLNAQGQVIPGTPDILATNYDTATVNGRTGQWRYDQSLAPSGQPQVLAPNATSQRRWLEFTGATWSQTIRIKLPTMATAVGVVPAVAPDSVPRALVNPSRVYTPPSGGGFPYYRDILLVGFHPGTSLAERARVVALAGASIAGGYTFKQYEGGLYLLKLPADSSQNTLLTSEIVLRSQASVKSVTRLLVVAIQPSYERPTEGGSWTAATWRVTPDSLLAPRAFRERWALEYIRAPLAWGCATGDSNTHVGLIDNGFRTSGVSDIPAFLRTLSGINLPTDTMRHGTRVMSVLAGQGNNNTGIAGVSWTTAVSLYDPTMLDSAGRPQLDTVGRRTNDITRVLVGIGTLARAGARVVNISLGASDAPVLDLQDASRVVQMRMLAGQVKDDVSSPGTVAPLIVISAGNVHNADPSVSALPLLKDSLPDVTIVVAAMDRDSSLSSAPAGSAYVDVVAPGEGVAIVDDRGVAFDNGASFATPLVSGLAALLLSFDSTLTHAEVRSLIIDGATRGGRKVGGYPVIDAYESLKLAAQRSGAPICGNRLFARNDSVYVQRDPANNSSDEFIAVLPQAFPNIAVEHGGKRIITHGWSNAGTYDLRHTASGWSAQPSTPTTPNSGFARSSEGTSHDGDSIAVYRYHAQSQSHYFSIADSNGNRISPEIAAINGAIAFDPTKPRFILNGADNKYWSIDFRTNQATQFASGTAGRQPWSVGIAEDGSEFVALSMDAASFQGHCYVEWRSLRPGEVGALKRTLTLPKYPANGNCRSDGGIGPRIAVLPTIRSR